MAKAQGRDAERNGYRGHSAPPIPAPSWRHRIYIERAADLETLADILSDAHVLAIDAEFVQSRTPSRARGYGAYSHRLMLLQFALDDDYSTSYVVDALRLADLSPLAGPLSDGRILKLFHGISADARVLATRNLEARNLLDLEAVSRSIFGQRESGLQAMIERACGLRLDKTLQRADWSRRPLTPAMIAYAARDAEMTFVLHGWLTRNYPWAVALHALPADEPPPAVAPWILAYIEGSRNRQTEQILLDAGLSHDVAAQVRDLREALTLIPQPTLPHPSQRVRALRLLTDLNLTALLPEVRPFLNAPTSEERAGALRTLGRLRDLEAEPAIEACLEDAVADVRQAAQLALSHLHSKPAPAPTRLARTASSRPTGTLGAMTWTVGDDDTRDGMDGAAWRDALRAQFGLGAAASVDDDVDDVDDVDDEGDEDIDDEIEDRDEL